MQSPVRTGFFVPEIPMPNDTRIRDAREGDAAPIADIYNVHVRSTIVTFELDEVACVEMARRVADVRAHGLPWLVAVDDAGMVLGYAYASPWKARAAYARSVESSIYLHEDARGCGIGRRLYAALIVRLREWGAHVVIGGAAFPNDASVALHEGLGFTYVGSFREVGQKLGRWIDVGYWQLLLEE